VITATGKLKIEMIGGFIMAMRSLSRLNKLINKLNNNRNENLR